MKIHEKFSVFLEGIRQHAQLRGRVNEFISSSSISLLAVNTQN